METSSILEIIPKITQPLAVICFALYIFYLFKRSEDKKQEKTLEDGDPQNRMVAIEKIFQSHPDFKLATITDQAEATKIAQEIIKGKLKSHQFSLKIFLCFTIVFALTFLASQVISNPMITGKSDDTSTSTHPSYTDSWAVIQSKKDSSKSYAILNVVLHIQVEDEHLNGKKTRRALFRTHYVLKTLRAIETDDKVFPEQYFSTAINDINRWSGSEREESEVDGSYWVKFAAKQNDIKSILTGANFFYPIPLPQTNETCYGTENLKNNEWVWCYRNTSDYIDNLSIVVESQNIDLDFPNSHSMIKSDNKSELRFGDAVKRKITDNSRCTLVAQWSKINPGECVSFKINWNIP